MSLVILIVLVLGVGAGYLMPADVSGFLDSASTYMLLLLLFSVGIDTGLNKAVFTRIRELGFRILLIPFGVALGSLCGGVVTAFLLSLPAKEGLAISAGLGWYSLSGVLITEAGNPVGGTIAFLANVFREMLTFVIVPFVASHLNYYANDARVKYWEKVNSQKRNRLYLRYQEDELDYLIVFEAKGEKKVRLITAYPIFFVSAKKDYEKDYQDYQKNIAK